jgi:serine/threonine-protein kinase
MPGSLAPPSLSVGALFGNRFRIQRVIGDGGMAVVYAAIDQRTNEQVALKLLRTESTTDTTVVGRFIREARVAKSIESEHVAAVRDFGVADDLGVPYIAFELLHGCNLEQLLAKRGPLPVTTAVDYVLQALVGVAAAHVQGIAHRDLKPSNLFLDESANPPTVKVLDFGIAKVLKGVELGRGPVSSTAMVVGSPLYMAPEQLRSSKRIDGRADVWSIGVILYELLTNKPPFRGASLGQLLTAILDEPPVPPDVHRKEIPAGLSAVILRCLDQDRERRFPTVKDLASALLPYGSWAAEELVSDIVYAFASETVQKEFAMDPEEVAAAPVATPVAVKATVVMPNRPRAKPAEPARRRKPSPASLAIVVVAGIAFVLAAMTIALLLARR